MIAFKTPGGRYYVQSVAFDGTLDVKQRPSARVAANRDAKAAAIAEENSHA